jgi:hypothetical protein
MNGQIDRMAEVRSGVLTPSIPNVSTKCPRFGPFSRRCCLSHLT